MLELPAGTHGAFARSQLRAELGRHHLAAAVAEGRLVPFGRKVLLDRSRMGDLRCRCAAVLMLLGPGAVLCGHTSALLHGCTAADDSTVHALVGYYRQFRPRLGTTVHCGVYEEADVRRIDGLRVLALEVAIAELLCRAPRHIALGCADQALGRLPRPERPTFHGEIAARIAERADSRGRRRAEVLLGLATGLPESALESSLLLRLFDAGFPLPYPQFSIQAVDGREVWRLDFAWPDQRIALEYDGYEAHERRAVADAARDEDLRRRGWLVIRATATDMREPTLLFGKLRAAFASRGVKV